ncbi:MAG: hypothetical protein HQM06_11625 [Magnetococcales bacterium]|nr:hypothetical protein [Magnetococcales bacterium]
MALYQTPYNIDPNIEARGEVNRSQWSKPHHFGDMGVFQSLSLGQCRYGDYVTTLQLPKPAAEKAADGILVERSAVFAGCTLRGYPKP